MKKFTSHSIGPRATADFKRVISLPRRDAGETGDAIVEAMTEWLKTPKGEQKLRPLQALILAEAADLGGAIGQLGVGVGKTHVSFLLGTVMEALRPVVLVPAKLRAKTLYEFAEIKKHWREPENGIKIISYEEVSRQPDLLLRLGADLLIADECQSLKNKNSTRTKRFLQYWEYSQCAFVAMSGTLTNRSIFDWWHTQLICLPDAKAVLPYHWPEANLWSRALDEKIDDPCKLGALEHFGKDKDEARKGFGEFLKQTPGIIVSEEQECPATITIDKDYFSSLKIAAALDTLYKKWELPDGALLTEGSEIWSYARQISNGFFYSHEAAPLAWKEARKDFNSRVRKLLKRSKKYTSPAQIIEAYKDEPRYAPEFQRWFDIKDTFEPTSHPVWITEGVLRYALYRVRGEKTLIWYEHQAVGQKLRELGLPVYGSEGLEISTGASLVHAKKACGVSVLACSEGFNLQHFCYNIILNCPPVGARWEQLLGRTHRSGQEYEEIISRLILVSKTQKKDFGQALADAEYISAMTGQKQKLLLADIITQNER